MEILIAFGAMLAVSAIWAAMAIRRNRKEPKARQDSALWEYPALGNEVRKMTNTSTEEQRYRKNIDTLRRIEDGVWADLEIGANARYLKGHAVALFRESLIQELAALVGTREFERCAIRATAGVYKGVAR